MSFDKMTGLEILQAMMAGKIPAPSMAETMPSKLVFAEEGFVRFLVRADKRHLNPMGGVHGGFSATILDSITGCAVQTLMEPGVKYSTINLEIKMIRPIPLDQELIAEGTMINRSRRLAVSEGKIMDEDGKIYAAGSATCMILS
ncbi:MAG: PaaI family thioesterase [Alphaproteobacteria bacterium]|nr:PaaI family thioesterase [Alphaproteobacteria bacterium]HPF45258.1 PaaI family thioesterase [Emcibacteraceae bacterium]HRW30368.1 PaaI family thioesterase [Emcibacteraceae bacterium]